jgi:hypothetical protein
MSRGVGFRSVQRDPPKLTVGSRDVSPRVAIPAPRGTFQRSQGGLLAGRPLIPGPIPARVNPPESMSAEAGEVSLGAR